MAQITAAFRSGRLNHVVEDQIAKVPSDAFVALSLGSIGLSLGARALGHKEASNFIGQWASVFMVLAVYDKLNKR